MAPEVFCYPQSAGYDERVDIWSIGCVVLQMITEKEISGNDHNMKA